MRKMCGCCKNALYNGGVIRRTQSGSGNLFEGLPEPLLYFEKFYYGIHTLLVVK